VKFIKRNIALYLLLLSVVSFNGMEFFHHHDDSASRDDSKCSACLFSSILSSADLGESVISVTPVITTCDYQSAAESFHYFEVLTSSQGRAPPLQIA
jgi:hypothetical protein